MSFLVRIYIYIFIHLARILTPPDIKYRRRQGQGDAMEHVACGKWKIRNWFYTTPEIHRWGIIYFGERPDERINGILQDFENQLPDVKLFLYLTNLLTFDVCFSFSCSGVMVLQSDRN
jgi:hypothetical protein